MHGLSRELPIQMRLGEVRICPVTSPIADHVIGFAVTDEDQAVDGHDC